MEYYDNLFCACGCGGRIPVKWWHKYNGIPTLLPHHQTEEVKKKKSVGATRIWADPENRRKRSGKNHFSKDLVKRQQFRIKMCGEKNPAKKPDARKKVGRANSINTKKLWQDPEYVRKQIQARNVQQNKTEKRLEFLITQVTSGFQFTGDGKFILAGKCPDFVNEEKHLIIELFGDYWHKPEEVESRTNLFVDRGYQTLVVWEHELQEPEKVVQRIQEFIHEN